MKVKINSKEDLQSMIASNFNSRKLFIESFNKLGGKIEKTKLSKHLSGYTELTVGWKSAYSIFFNKWREIELFNYMYKKNNKDEKESKKESS